MTYSKKITVIILNSAKCSNNDMIEWCVVLNLISKEISEMSRKLAEISMEFNSQQYVKYNFLYGPSNIRL